MTTTTNYCDQSHIQYILRRAGLQSFMAQDGDTNSPVTTWDIDNAINRASTQIDFYLDTRYDPGNLVGNDYVTWACAIIASVEIIRRDNAVQSGLQADYDKIIDQLERIQRNEAGCEVPLTVPRSELGAWESAIRVDQRFGITKMRVSQTLSSNDQTSAFQRFLDPSDLWVDLWSLTLALITTYACFMA